MSVGFASHHGIAQWTKSQRQLHKYSNEGSVSFGEFFISLLQF